MTEINQHKSTGDSLSQLIEIVEIIAKDSDSSLKSTHHSTNKKLHIGL